VRNHFTLFGTLILVLSVVLIQFFIGDDGPLGSSARVARAAVSSGAPATGTMGRNTANLADLQALFFVWASGTPAVQRLAAQDCERLTLSARQCAKITAATRAAWLDMARRDPSAVGRPGARPNLASRVRALSALTAELNSATNGHVAALLSATQASLTEISQPQWVWMQMPPMPAGTVLVWATSFLQNPLPNGLNPTTSPYVALPDAYLKYADWGLISNIPTIYQPYYAPGGKQANWTVNIATAPGMRKVTGVPITDVGPWNEDDNWWDPNATTTTLAASCPVASPPAFTDATSNALVDGICPTGAAGGNQRRIYYYLLYQHDGLPFFQSAGYAPNGGFADGSNWPVALGYGCSEAAEASQSTGGVFCYNFPSSYNDSNGGWLRDGTYDSGIANHSSIDLSPAVDGDLGWVYPSSGLVQVTVSALP
jgi:hypothetical protein